jgi:hypothetical protein
MTALELNDAWNGNLFLTLSVLKSTETVTPRRNKKINNRYSCDLGIVSGIINQNLKTFR